MHRSWKILLLGLLISGCALTQPNGTTSTPCAVAPSRLEQEQRVGMMIADHVRDLLNEYRRAIHVRQGNPADLLNRYFQIVRTAYALEGREGARNACNFADIVHREVITWNTQYACDQTASYASRDEIIFDEDVQILCYGRTDESEAQPHCASRSRAPSARMNGYQLCWENGVAGPCPPPLSGIFPRR